MRLGKALLAGNGFTLSGYANLKGACMKLPCKGERMSVQNTINQANKVEFSYTKRREIIPKKLLMA
ncbi:hypothetical protein [Motilimonas cestriensis]|uniref:hypothetical protein n=1 Tax=Motilimonas cestriensis TaxID=2742685 RepID=UPI003DA4D287